MEDAHTHLLALPDDRTAAFFAVYDGHGCVFYLSRFLNNFSFRGSRVSQYAGLHLHKRIVNNSFYGKRKYFELQEFLKNLRVGRSPPHSR